MSDDPLVGPGVEIGDMRGAERRRREVSGSSRRLAVRWTIGDVSEYGFDALRYSVWGAWRLFGAEASYTICVNTVPLEVARSRVGELPEGVRWRQVDRELPAFLSAHLDSGMAEGVGWKFAPLQVDGERHTLALDNDCILWELPAALASWLESDDPRACVLAADVVPSYGAFARLCDDRALNTGIRGLAPGFQLETALRQTLERHPVRLTSELDEQGLQVAALCRFGEVAVVTLDEVTISSPFPPHLAGLGRCGAHFVGLNAHDIPWSYEGRPALEVRREHWLRWRGEVERRVFGGEPKPPQQDQIRSG